MKNIKVITQSVWLSLKVSPFYTILYFTGAVTLGALTFYSQYLVKPVIDTFERFFRYETGLYNLVLIIGLYFFMKYFVLANLLFALNDYSNRKFSFQLDNYLVRELMSSGYKQDQYNYLRREHLEALNYAIIGVNERKHLVSYLSYPLNSIVTFCSIGFIFIKYDYRIMLFAIIITCTTVPFKVAISKMLYNLNIDISRKMRSIDYKSNLNIMKSSKKELSVLGKSDYFADVSIESYNKVQTHIYKTKSKVDIISKSIDFFSMTASYLSLIFLIYLFRGKRLSVGEIIMLWGMLRVIIMRTPFLVKYLSDLLFKSSYHVTQYEDFIESSCDIRNTFDDRIDSIELKDASFKYPYANEYALRNINLHVESGQKICILGYNGSGKTTLSQLLCGILSPSSGSYHVNGLEVNNIDRQSLYKQFNFQFQDYFKYPFSLKDNIILDCPYEHEKYTEITKTFNIASIENTLIKGLNTTLSNKFDETGVDLSVGQWNRIALARACYNGNNILMLDEPSASIDYEEEKRVLEMIRELPTDKTAIFISHKISFARMADRIYLLENGQIIESGSHEHLIEKRGKYYNYFKSQEMLYEENSN